MTELAIAPTPPDPEQLLLEGLPAEVTAFSLQANRLYTEQRMSMNTYVEGTYRGRVRGHKYLDGRLTFIVEVTEATLERG